MSDQQFPQLVATFNKIYLDWWGFTQVAEPAAAGLELLLKRKVKLTQEELSVLTAPTKKSYTLEVEEEIFRLALLYKKNKSIPKSQLVKLVHRYFWLNNGYAHTYVLDGKYFRKQIIEVASKMSVKQIIEGLKANVLRLESAQNNVYRLSKQLSLSKEEFKIVKRIAWFADFQDKRKAISLEANYYIDLFIKELARRTGISYNLVRYAIPLEYSNLLHGKFSITHLRARQYYFAMIIDEKGIRLFEGNAARRMEKKLLGEISDEVVREIEGMRAMGGRIIGNARVILKTKDVYLMKRGEILVTTMTSPDFISAMKKAKALVTDEGGLTCHAAIISRELNIPCVVGTKIATRTLKTGDKIEVDANHGLVRIIK